MTNESTEPKSSALLAARGEPRPAGAPGQHAVKLERSVYSGRVATYLREAIIAGTLEPGTPLVEARLAEQISVSRGPIRNALHVLEGEGLVRTLRNGRTVVVGFGDEDVADLVSVRFELESAAIRRGIDRGADATPIRAAFEAIEREGASTERLVDLDIDFHRTLFAFSGSRFLTQAWLPLAPVIHTVITIGNRRLVERDPEKDFARILAVHRPIVEAIERGDTARALAVLDEQFTTTREVFRATPEA